MKLRSRGVLRVTGTGPPTGASFFQKKTKTHFPNTKLMGAGWSELREVGRTSAERLLKKDEIAFAYSKIISSGALRVSEDGAR